MSEEAPAVAPVAAAAERGFLSVLGGVFVSPFEAFRAVAARPRWEAPLLLAVAVGLAFTAIWISKADAVTFMRAQLEESGGINMVQPYQQERLVQAQAKWFKAYAWVVPLFFGPVGYAALAAVFLLLYRFFYAADVGYRQSLAVVAWCFAAFHLLVDPLALVVMSLKNEWSVDPASVLQASVGALLDKQTAARPLYALAESLDLFHLWLMALLSIGYGAVIGRRPLLAAAPIVALWAIYVAGKVFFAAVL